MFDKKGTLFERLNSKNNFVSVDEGFPAHSVARNLANIFSSNKGSSLSAPKYGRPDLNNVDLSLFDSLIAIEEQIEESIRLYESRLHSFEVELVKDSLLKNEIQYIIDGKLLVDGKDVDVRYHSRIGANGKVEVELV